MSRSYIENTEYAIHKLKKEKNICCISLFRCHVTKNDFKKIIKITKNEKIKYLRIDQSTININGFKIFLTNLHTKKIKTIDISETNIGDIGCISLCNLIEDLDSVEKLNLCYNKFNIDGCKRLKQLLKNNKTITELKIDSNKINNNNLKVICKGLENNDSVTELQLWNNSISDVSYEYLSNLLKKNKTITSLNISENPSNGIMLMCKALYKSKFIKEIKLEYRNDNVENEFVTTLIKNSKFIEKISLDGYTDQDKSSILSTSICDSLKYDNSIIELHLSFTKLCSHFESISKYNYNMKKINKYFDANSETGKMLKRNNSIPECDFLHFKSYDININMKINNKRKYDKI